MKTNCYFFIDDTTKCVWDKKCCCFCSYKIKSIKGMDRIENMKDYVCIVVSKNNARRAFWVSTIALLISLFTLFINYVDNKEKIKDLIQQESKTKDYQSITKSSFRQICSIYRDYFAIARKGIFLCNRCLDDARHGEKIGLPLQKKLNSN